MILKRITNPKNTGIGITYPNDSQYHLYVLNKVVYPAGRDNLEYQITSEMLQSLYLLRMHNPEGYADNVRINPYGPFYYYYNKDHLGNNREVWRAAYSINGTVTPARIVQQTSYYPSGLPWSDGTGAITQP